MSLLVTPAFAPTNGMTMLSSDEQPLNAPSPMLVTLSGIITLVSEPQFSKALLFIPVTGFVSKLTFGILRSVPPKVPIPTTE